MYRRVAKHYSQLDRDVIRPPRPGAICSLQLRPSRWKSLPSCYRLRGLSVCATRRYANHGRRRRVFARKPRAAAVLAREALDGQSVQIRFGAKLSVSNLSATSMFVSSHLRARLFSPSFSLSLSLILRCEITDIISHKLEDCGLKFYELMPRLFTPVNIHNRKMGPRERGDNRRWNANEIKPFGSFVIRRQGGGVFFPVR